MTEGNEFHPPKIYAIWVDARPESPMAGLSGFLSENSRRLFFTERGDAELKIRDMEALRLNRHPAAEYRCVEYPGGYDAERAYRRSCSKQFPYRQTLRSCGMKSQTASTATLEGAAW